MGRCTDHHVCEMYNICLCTKYAQGVLIGPQPDYPTEPKPRKSRAIWTSSTWGKNWESSGIKIENSGTQEFGITLGFEILKEKISMGYFCNEKDFNILPIPNVNRKYLKKYRPEFARLFVGIHADFSQIGQARAGFKPKTRSDWDLYYAVRTTHSYSESYAVFKYVYITIKKYVWNVWIIKQYGENCSHFSSPFCTMSAVAT